MFPPKLKQQPIVASKPSPPPVDRAAEMPKQSLEKQMDLIKSQANANGHTPAAPPPPLDKASGKATAKERDDLSKMGPREDSGIKLRVGSSGGAGQHQVAPAPQPQSKGTAAPPPPPPPPPSASRNRLSSLSKKLGKHAPSLLPSLAHRVSIYLSSYIQS